MRTLSLDASLVRLGRYIITVVVGLSLPVILIFIIHFTGFSEVVEEVAKAVIVYFVIAKFTRRKDVFIAGLFFGALFGFSESIFYLSNSLGDGVQDVALRLISTVPMHSITALILVCAFLSKNKIVITAGIFAAVAVHLLFNSFIAG